VVIGVQLLKNSEKIFVFAYGQSEQAEMAGNPEKFRFFLKMPGVFLIADYLPVLIDLLKILLCKSCPVYSFVSPGANPNWGKSHRSLSSMDFLVL
jgi:hypothetical protein